MDKRLVYLDGGDSNKNDNSDWAHKDFEVKSMSKKDPNSVSFDSSAVYTKGFDTLDAAEQYADSQKGPTVIIDVKHHTKKLVRGALKQFGGLLDPGLKDMEREIDLTHTDEDLEATEETAA